FQYLDAAGHTVLTLSACRFRRVDLIGRRHGKPGRYVFALEAKPAAEDAVSAAAPSPASLLATAAATVAGIEDAAHRDRHLAEVMPLL
ncbi:hypothetical protein, partial [Chromohalobacter sp. HP20-39]